MKINIERKHPKMSGSPGMYLTKCQMFLYKSLWLQVPWVDTFIRDYG